MKITTILAVVIAACMSVAVAVPAGAEDLPPGADGDFEDLFPFGVGGGDFEAPGGFGGGYVGPISDIPVPRDGPGVAISRHPDGRRFCVVMVAKVYLAIDGQDQEINVQCNGWMNRVSIVIEGQRSHDARRSLVFTPRPAYSSATQAAINDIPNGANMTLQLLPKQRCVKDRLVRTIGYVTLYYGDWTDPLSPVIGPERYMRPGDCDRVAFNPA